MKIYFLEQVCYLGNCIISLTNVINLCKKEGVKFSTDLSKFWKKIPFIEIEKIPFFVREFDSNDCLIKSNFFHSTIAISKEERLEIIEKYIKPYTNFSFRQIPETTCVIHIRSGEIFDAGGTHKNYIQPPFAFYQKIIDEEKYERFLVVTQNDRRNPTIELIEKYSKKVEVQSSTLRDDLSVILSASSIVAGFGTFLSQVLFFNSNIKKIYCLDYTDYFSYFGTNAELITYKLLDQYVPVGKWTNSLEQLSMMINYPVEKIERL